MSDDNPYWVRTMDAAEERAALKARAEVLEAALRALVDAVDAHDGYLGGTIDGAVDAACRALGDKS